MYNSLIVKKDSIFLFLFKLLILVYVFIDFIRRFFEGNKVLLISLDFVVVITILYFISVNNFKLKYLTKKFKLFQYIKKIKRELKSFSVRI